MHNYGHRGVGAVGTRFVSEEGRLIIARSQDCTPIAEDAQRRHNEGMHGSSEMKHAARIPNVIIEKYMNERGVTFEQFMADPIHIKRLVEDPDNAMFRIWKGAL